jgi:FKBP-type peptidyl-prolyl cis-trans isomerase
MKKTTLCLMHLAIFLFFLNTSFAQKEATKKQEVDDRSYSYGAMLSKGISRMGFTEAERNPEKFVAGIKKGMEGDSAIFAEAQKALQQRMQNKTPSADEATAHGMAHVLGINVIGSLATEIKMPATDFNFEVLKAAFIAAEKGEKLKYTDTQMDSILKIYFNPRNEEVRKKQEAKKMAQADGAIKAGKAFMEKNAKREGVITLPSGMQYEVVKQGTGAKPTINDKVKTHYHGTLVTGEIFDSSVDRGEPATFGVNQVIKGWQEGIPLMPVGSKYRFFIPQDLAYGLQSPSPKIPAGSTLIFDVELIEINPGQKEANAVLEEGKKFLAENAKKPGVVTLPSGLQYLVLVEGSGPKATITDKVKVHYHGTLTNGTVFDSSVERGQPATFGVNQVIKGWQEGIPLMSAGAKYRLFIPQELAYGNRASGKIPAGSALIFDVELFEINPK